MTVYITAVDYSTNTITIAATTPTTAVVYRKGDTSTTNAPGVLLDFVEVIDRLTDRKSYAAKRLASIDGVELTRDELERRPAPTALRARHGYQELARIPCYRGVRTR